MNDTFRKFFLNPFEKRISFVLKIIVYFPFIFLLYDYKTACSVQKQVRENVCLLNRSLKACKKNVRSFLKKHFENSVLQVDSNDF